MGRLHDKVSIVTGAARGLGKGIAEKLCKEGATVVIADISEEACRDVVNEFTEKGYEAAYCATNIANQEEVKNLFAYTVREFDTVDILVNNAGINRDVTIHKMTVDQWQQVIDVNLTGTFFCTQEAALLMREKEYGRIISISSASWLGNFGQANYAASKAGVVGLTKTASRELAIKNITCNAICPGFIETDMTRGVPEKVWDIMVSKIPMKRAGSPSDVANMVAFLASDEASYITGEVINVGGGMIL
ncbi:MULTISPECIES: 3-oxoacyl-ACP reductase FabG [Bacillaceae]|jgi:3-oxoacyl-(acyl-carrier-protein) reductase|uniref:3-oxoacyl-ACP reductase FabG n=1 Tax=Niallia hominis TaxID=3133173 RepID=A0ABV1F0S4_9BACI|nr:MULTISPECIES: 3-oxoacyl-ACP reductase FabG [Bacillaceae]MCF2647078.1 3-oxoacyl-ACP reductase FabG [Niallia circulans]CAI9392955.1 3-oxoacyl-[acyl-carrier-protein] reductase FabG [Bacillus sp. T2.9-1]